MANVMCLHLSMQDEDILEHTNVKCYLCTFLVDLEIIMYRIHTPHDIIEHSHAKILVCGLGWHKLTLIMKLLVMTHYYNLGYASK